MTTPGSHGPGEQPPSGGTGWGPPAGSPQFGSPQPGSPPGSPQPGGWQPGSVPPPPPGQSPPGQYPSAQGEHPQGQPSQGQYPPGQGPEGQYSAQGPEGQYSAQGPESQYSAQGQFPQGQGWAPPPTSKSKVGKWAAIAGGILALLVIGLVALAFLGGGDPEVGDCLSEENQELSVVDCDDADAAWRLVGIQEGEQSYDEYLEDPATCEDFLPETTQSFWVGENGDQSGQGVVYCVAGA